MSPKTTCRATARVKLSVIPRGTDRQLRINLGVGSLFVSNKMRRMGGVKVGYLAPGARSDHAGLSSEFGVACSGRHSLGASFGALEPSRLGSEVLLHSLFYRSLSH